MQGDDVGGHGLLICGRQRLPRLSRLARGPAGSPGLRLLGGRGLRHRTDKGLERRARRVLLGLLLGRAVARAQRLRAGEDDRRVLALVAYSRAFAVVHRRLAETFLSDLLELALEVLVTHRRRQGAITVQVVVVGRVVPGVEEDRAEHRLEGVREQRLQTTAAAFGDALPEVEVAAKVELLRELGEGVRVDHRRARLRELALGRAGVMLVEVLGRDQLQDSVAEVLEALVVARRNRRRFIGERAVGDRFEQQPGVAKVDSDLLLEKLQRLCERCSGSLCYEPAFSWMYSHA